MEEILELKGLIQQQDYQSALFLVAEMEEMGREAIIDKIYSYVVVLLLHLIKQESEKRTTKSWSVSIRNSCRQIERTNKRRKSDGYYLQDLEIKEIIAEAFEADVDKASLEAFEGNYTAEELASFFDANLIADKAWELIKSQSK